MVLALAIVSAAILVPAAASAQSWHLSATTSFSVFGNGGTLRWENGWSGICSSTTGSGSFSTTTEGTVSMKFEGCGGGLGCKSPGQPSGTIAFSAKFDAIMVAANKPAILFTPTGSAEPTPGLKTLWEMSCFGFTEKIFGKGIIGTISTPGCGIASSTATVTFESSAPGSQADKTYTGNTFDLASTLSTTSHPTFSLDAQWSLTFPAARTMTCTS